MNGFLRVTRSTSESLKVAYSILDPASDIQIASVCPKISSEDRENKQVNYTFSEHNSKTLFSQKDQHGSKKLKGKILVLYVWLQKLKWPEKV